MVFGLQSQRAAARQVVSGNRWGGNGKGRWRWKSGRKRIAVIHWFHEAGQGLERAARVGRLQEIDRVVWRLVRRARRRLVRGAFRVRVPRVLGVRVQVQVRVLAGRSGGAIDLLVAMTLASERSQVSLDRRLLAAPRGLPAFIVEPAISAD